MASVKLTNVKKVYDNHVEAVKDFNLDIADKEFIVFVGPSGCGKSTTLRMIAGLEEISGGTVEIDGEVVNDLQPKDRNIAMVFQNYALYPHLSVFENMAFPLRLNKKVRYAPLTEEQVFNAEVEIKKLKEENNPQNEKRIEELKDLIANGKRVKGFTSDEIFDRVTKTAEILGITEYLLRKPRALSGGQRQRVAIGRAMVRDSKVFLMDEPLSNLDAKLRNQMRAEIILLRKKIDSTFIYVTHDQTEAMTLGDRIVIMKDGYIMQVGTPTEVFDHPDNLFVAEFIGAPKMNTFETELMIEDGSYYISPLGAKIKIDDEKSEILKANNVKSGKVIMGVRPEHMVLADSKSDDTIECTILVNEMMGSELHLHVITENETKLIVRVPTLQLTTEQRMNLRSGEKVYVTFASKVVHLFDSKTQVSLLKK